MKKKYLVLFILVFIVSFSIVIFQTSKGSGNNEYKDINLTEYEDKLDKKESFIVYIYSTSCEACERFSPILNEKIKEHGIEVLALNVLEEKNKDTTFFKKQNLKLTPTIILYKDGVEKNRRIGNISAEGLEEFLKDIK
ncbi:thioredoxin family protein [Bacillus anthracis]|uniref:thioredoxin family protein n=1 Tax=Bacillus anthracis TaxID=1392 RepID=UPI003D220F32